MIRSDTEHFNTATASHAGMRGKQNEDRFSVTHWWAGQKKKKPAVLAVLCDGIGGHRAGEVAAEIGVRTVTDSVAAGDPQRPINTLERAIHQANQAVYQASTSDRGRLGMGTTCACAWVIDGRLYTVNLGDSRIYLLRDGHIIQLSTDHTWIQEALDAGLLSDLSQEDHPNAHVIRRYLGSENPPEPDFRLWFFEGESDAEALANQGLQLSPGDILLLCSDGLTDLVSDPEIQEVIQNLPLEQASDRLVSLANTRGGHDNITVILMRTPEDKRRFWASLTRKRALVGCLAVLAVISALIATAVFGLRWWLGTRNGAPTEPPAATSTQVWEDLASSGSRTPSPSPTLSLTYEGGEETQPPPATRTPWPTHTVQP
jgi:protein phosphatase